MVDEHSSFPSAHFLLVMAGWEMRTAAEVGAKKMLSGKEKKKLKEREREKENTTPAPPLWIFQAPPPISLL